MAAIATVSANRIISRLPEGPCAALNRQSTALAVPTSRQISHRIAAFRAGRIPWPPRQSTCFALRGDRRALAPAIPMPRRWPSRSSPRLAPVAQSTSPQAMAPRIRTGDYVWVDSDESAAHGSFVAVRNSGRGGDTFVRFLIVRAERRTLRALDDCRPEGAVDAGNDIDIRGGVVFVGTRSERRHRCASAKGPAWHRPPHGHDHRMASLVRATAARYSDQNSISKHRFSKRSLRA